MFNAPNDIFKHWNKPCFIASNLEGSTPDLTALLELIYFLFN